MAHTPQASLSSSAASSRGDLRHQEVRATSRNPGPTSSSSAGSGSVRSSEDEAFERAAVKLRPAWASDVAPKLLPHGLAELGGVLDDDEPVAGQAQEDEEPVSGFTALPKVAADATRHEPPQPIFAAAQSAFPAPSPSLGRAPVASGETGQFIAAIARPARRVRWLAIGSAACLAIGVVWALASRGSSSDSNSDVGKSPATSAQPSVNATESAARPAATHPSAAVASSRNAPAAPATAGASQGRSKSAAASAPSVPTGLEIPRAQPASSAPIHKVASKPAVDKPSASKPVVSKPAVSKPAVSKAQPAATKAAANKRALAKAGTPVRATTATKASAPARSKSNVAAPVPTKRKPTKASETKSAKRKRATTAVLDPWGN